MCIDACDSAVVYKSALLNLLFIYRLAITTDSIIINSKQINFMIQQNVKIVLVRYKRRVNDFTIAITKIL